MKRPLGEHLVLRALGKPGPDHQRMIGGQRETPGGRRAAPCDLDDHAHEGRNIDLETAVATRHEHPVEARLDERRVHLLGEVRALLDLGLGLDQLRSKCDRARRSAPSASAPRALTGPGLVHSSRQWTLISHLLWIVDHVGHSLPEARHVMSPRAARMASSPQGRRRGRSGGARQARGRCRSQPRSPRHPSVKFLQGTLLLVMQSGSTLSIHAGEADKTLSSCAFAPPWAVMPPSIGISAPLICDDSSELSSAASRRERPRLST